MAVTNYLSNLWVRSGYFKRTIAIAYAAPMAIWGVCTVESVLRCALRALHTAISLNASSRKYRWEQTKIHAVDALGTSLLTLVTPVPFIGTFKSYEAMLKLIYNHVCNTWMLRDLQQQVNAHATEKLYQELCAWEPDLEKLLSYAMKTAPTNEQIQRVATQLQASLIGRSIMYTMVFHLIDNSCRAVKIIAMRIKRLISALFSGLIYRTIVRGIATVKNGIQQEVGYVCNLVDQPGRMILSEEMLNNLHRDAWYGILNSYKTPQEREDTRLRLAKIPSYRKFMICNFLTKLPSDSPLPEGAPETYFHLLRELPRACAHYSRQEEENPKEQNLTSFFKYFSPILPFIDTFKNEWIINMSPQAKAKLLWHLVKRLPNLRDITLDMNQIDERWQMLILAQLAKSSHKLQTVTLVRADQRAPQIMRYLANWRCTVTTQ